MDILFPTGVGQSRHTEEEDAGGLGLVGVPCVAPSGEEEDEEDEEVFCVCVVAMTLPRPR